MLLVKLRDESKRVIGIVAEGYVDEIRFTRYFVNKYGVYVSKVLAEGVELDDLYAPDIGEKTLQEQKVIRLKNIKREAEKRFPNAKKVYYQE